MFFVFRLSHNKLTLLTVFTFNNILFCTQNAPSSSTVDQKEKSQARRMQDTKRPRPVKLINSCSSGFLENEEGVPCFLIFDIFPKMVAACTNSMIR